MSLDWLERILLVKSVFGRTGDIVATSGDYGADLVSFDNSVSGIVSTNAQDAIDEAIQISADAVSDYQAADELLRTGTTITAAPTGTQHNYSPTGWQDCTHLALGDDVTITGFAAPSAGKSTVKYLTVSANKTVTINSQSASSTAANRVKLPQWIVSNGDPLIMRDEDAAVLVYSSADSRWHMIPGAKPGKYIAAAPSALSTTSTLVDVSTMFGATTWNLTTTGGGPFGVGGFTAPSSSYAVNTTARVVRFAGAITVTHEDATVTASARIRVFGGKDFVAASGDEALVQYDSAALRWVMIPWKLPASTLLFGSTAIPCSSSAPTSGQLVKFDGTNFVGVTESTLSVASAALAAEATVGDGLKFNATSIACSATAPTNGQVLYYNGTTIAGLSQSSIVAGEATVGNGLKFNATSIACSSSVPTSGQLLRYNGTSIAGISTSALSVASAAGLVFTSTYPCSSTNPTTNQLLYSDGTNIAGVSPGFVMSRLTASNFSTQALTFTGNALYTWNGTATPSFTASSTSAIDGATIAIQFAASTLTSITFDSNLDPTGTLAYAFDDSAAAYMLTVTFRAGMNTVAADFRKCADMA